MRAGSNYLLHKLVFFPANHFPHSRRLFGRALRPKCLRLELLMPFGLSLFENRMKGEFGGIESIDSDRGGRFSFLVLLESSTLRRKREACLEGPLEAPLLRASPVQSLRPPPSGKSGGRRAERIGRTCLGGGIRQRISQACRSRSVGRGVAWRIPFSHDGGIQFFQYFGSIRL